jgi:hypothetical protein
MDVKAMRYHPRERDGYGSCPSLEDWSKKDDAARVYLGVSEGVNWCPSEGGLANTKVPLVYSGQLGPASENTVGFIPHRCKGCGVCAILDEAGLWNTVNRIA